MDGTSEGMDRSWKWKGTEANMDAFFATPWLVTMGWRLFELKVLRLKNFIFEVGMLKLRSLITILTLRSKYSIF